MRTILLAGALLAGSMLPVVAQTTLDSLPGPESLPEGTIRISPLVPGMGENWAREADLPLGPIYCVQEGKVVCIGYMLD